MKFKNKHLENKINAVTSDDVLLCFSRLGRKTFPCHMCGSETYSFVTQDHSDNMVVYSSTTLRGDDLDEHALFYKMVCTKCGLEYPLNAIKINSQLDAIKENG